MAAHDAEEVLDPGMPGLIDFPPRRRAVVLDEEEAWNTPCLRLELDGDEALFFSRAAVGPLDDEQRAKFCSAGEETVTLSAEQAARLQRSAAAARHCQGEVANLADDEVVPPYLACMRAQLRRQDAASG